MARPNKGGASERPEGAGPQPGGRLLALNPTGPHAREFVLGLKDQVLVGSDEKSNDFVVPAGTVSRRHASITYRDGEYRIVDFGSTNGTFVNGRRVSGSTIMRDGDEVGFGAVHFVFSRVQGGIMAGRDAAGSPSRGMARRFRSLSARSLTEVILVAFVLGFGLAQYLAYRLYHEQNRLLLAQAVPIPMRSSAAKEAHAGAVPNLTKGNAPSRPQALTHSSGKLYARMKVANAGGPDGSPTGRTMQLITPNDLRAAVTLSGLFSGSGSLAGAPAPGFTLTSLTGREVSLSDFRGKVVLLNFWATWCPHCRDEMPSLARLSGDFGDQREFALLTVSIDQRGAAVVRPFVQENGYKFPVLLDPNGRVGNAYKVTGVPSTFLIGPGGQILWNCAGGIDWSSEEVRRVLSEMVNPLTSGAPTS